MKGRGFHALGRPADEAGCPIVHQAPPREERTEAIGTSSGGGAIAACPTKSGQSQAKQRDAAGQRRGAEFIANLIFQRGFYIGKRGRDVINPKATIVE